MAELPLKGIRVLDVSVVWAGPYVTMMLSDLGARVIRVDRRHHPADGSTNAIRRNRESIVLNLKHPSALRVAKGLLESSDVLIEAYRPGVMERLGLGPKDVMEGHPGLVYGRLTGWGQSGPLSSTAGHDITYLAVTGALYPMGPPDRPPTPPVNYVADMGGGAMLLVVGILAALHERQRSGRGQVVDAAMVDGVSLLMASVLRSIADGSWSDRRGDNVLDGAAPFYTTYECADGEFIAVGAIEPQFYAELLRLSGLEGQELPHQMDRGQWPAMKERVAEIFKTKTRDEWCELMEHTDVCFAPVLSLGEAPQHPHNVQRGTFVEEHGVVQPAPAPRFSRTQATIQRPPAHAGQHTDEVLEQFGFDADRIAKLREVGAIK